MGLAWATRGPWLAVTRGPGRQPLPLEALDRLTDPACNLGGDLQVDARESEQSCVLLSEIRCIGCATAGRGARRRYVMNLRRGYRGGALRDGVDGVGGVLEQPRPQTWTDAGRETQSMVAFRDPRPNTPETRADAGRETQSMVAFRDPRPNTPETGPRRRD